jgi:hypothetical protein
MSDSFINPSAFPRVPVVSALVRLQEEYLPYHPDLRTFHYPNEAPAQKELAKSRTLSRNLTSEDIQAIVADRRRMITENATDVIYNLTKLMAERLQLSDLALQVPPKVVCSDYVMTKQEWSAGMEDGYYEVSGTFFTCVNRTPNSRIDGRLRGMIGPVIHLDNSSLVEPSLTPYAEETIHYLQWLHQTPTTVIDRIITWRAYYEADPKLREISVAAMKARKLSLDFPLTVDVPTTSTEGGILLLDNCRPNWRYPASIDLTDGQPQVSLDNEGLASRVLYEAVAELLRLEFGITEATSLAEHFTPWEERGIAGWNTQRTGTQTCGAACAIEQSEDTETIFACYRLFRELPWHQFVEQLSRRNGGLSLDKIADIFQLASQGYGAFPRDLAHFLGYTLGVELHRSGIFNTEAGMQEASLRFFSPLVSATDRLMSMKGLLDSGVSS